MTNEERDTVQLIKIANTDEQEERHPRAILETNPSIISLGNSNIDSNIVINVFDEIYSNRTHRKCISISYLTLLSMTLAITFWMFHWIAYNRCKNVKDDPELELFLCDLAVVLETLTFILLGITPILFITMILFWIHYSCYNPMDSIRENKILLKVEDNQWEEQLNYYFNKKKCRYFNCFRRKQRKELKERKYGYIILSPHGIVIDELILLSAQKNIIDNGILLDNNKVLKLTFKRTWTRPWKIRISIYLPDNPANPINIEEIKQLLKI
jgi:hypothetical protein